MALDWFRNSTKQGLHRTDAQDAAACFYLCFFLCFFGCEQREREQRGRERVMACILVSQYIRHGEVTVSLNAVHEV